MDIDADWKGLYDLLNDLIRQNDTAELETELAGNIDKLIPADRGAPFFTFDDHPICMRWPVYSSSKIQQFNSHYNKICPVDFRMADMMLGPVSWRKFKDTEYDFDFNRPLDIGHSMGCGFKNEYDRTTRIIVINRSRKSRPFSKADEQNIKQMTEFFSILYNRRLQPRTQWSDQISKLNQCRGGTPLSHRETEVCELLSRGFTAKQIAETLLISPRTIERHCLHIYQKMNIRNRKELLSLLYASRD